MIKCIIFDFNRTLYIPELQKIPEEAIKLLKDLRTSGLLLVLISIKEAQRDKLIDKYTLSSFFSVIKFVEEKDIKLFGETLKFLGCQPNEVIVVGDRIKSEIKIANQLGIKTIWYRNGKFSNELPNEEMEFPTWTINNLFKVEEIIENINTGKISNRKSKSIKSQNL
jgi:putative hydrolase of the HAD superfamily